MNLEALGDVVNLGDIYVGEALESGSFTRTEGSSPSVSIKFVVRGAVDAYPAYLAVVEHLKRNYWVGDEQTGYCAAYDLPLDSINLQSTGSLYAYTATCTFQYAAEDETSAGDPSGSSQSTNRNRHGTSANNPSINTVEFALPEIEPNDFQYSTIGGNKHITQAYEQLQYVNSTTVNAFKNYDKGVNFNGERFEGIEVVCPSESFSITISAPNYMLNDSFKYLITECTGCTNQYPFLGYDTDCVLFKGMNANPVALNYTDAWGNQVKDWYWRFKYEFEARRGEIVPKPDGAIWQAGNTQAEQADIKRRQDKLAEMTALETEILTQITQAQLNAWMDGLDGKGWSWNGANYPNEFAFCVFGIQENFLSLQKPVNDYYNAKKDYEKINNTVAGFYKPGFWYIWFGEPLYTVNANGIKVPIVTQANVAKVYPSVDFGHLHLPGIPVVVEEEEEEE